MPLRIFWERNSDEVNSRLQACVWVCAATVAKEIKIAFEKKGDFARHALHSASHKLRFVMPFQWQKGYVILPNKNKNRHHMGKCSNFIRHGRVRDIECGILRNLFNLNVSLVIYTEHQTKSHSCRNDDERRK